MKLLTPWGLLKLLWSWWRPTPTSPPAPPPPAPTLRHFIRSKQIVAGHVIVMNMGSENVRLEGPVLRSLFILAGGIATVKSPLLEPVWRIKSVIMETITDETREKLQIPKVKSVDTEIAFVNEWDALEVVENMIEEYARARAYDMMTPGELSASQLPLTKEALRPIIESLGLKAQRENENVPAQA
jgi:hypothetical protein